MSTLKTVRILLWLLVAAALIGMAALLLRARSDPEAEPIAATSVKIGGPFTLIGGDGKAFSSTQLSGKPYAIFFGFTHCPDVCPTTLARLAKLRRELGQGDRPFEIVFVTVDPERDGPKEVGQYAGLFNAPIIGLTGSPARIAQVKKQFGIYSKKVPGHHGTDYSVDHTATVLLFDRNGTFVATIAPEENDPAALGKLKRIAA